MEQFDVYANPSKSSRAAYPFIVDIQNPNLSELATRIVIPLGRKADLKHQELTKLTPTVKYEGEALLLLVPQVTSMPAKALRNPIGSLAQMRDDIVAALDFAITGI